jgi:hypothetical protein
VAEAARTTQSLLSFCMLVLYAEETILRGDTAFGQMPQG